MKIHPEDYEEIGHNFTRGLGQGCGAIIGLALVIGTLALIARWLA